MYFFLLPLSPLLGILPFTSPHFFVCVSLSILSSSSGAIVRARGTGTGRTHPKGIGPKMKTMRHSFESENWAVSAGDLWDFV